MTLDQLNRLYTIIHSRDSKADKFLKLRDLINEVGNEEFEAGKNFVKNGDQ